ncbi:MAG: hypothetical protein JW814_12060 [Candidatus Krumholzibacteriota bacterium]|nr:hypothetical protein [Candidatus Krumholzibacteriota bacterium]
MVEERSWSLEGRTLFIPRMSSGGSEAFAAAFRHFGIEAHVVPEGDERTYELAGRFTSGDECLPERVTVGNFVKVIEQPGFDPARTAFLMPTAGGPCRFGQYAPFLRQILDDMGYPELMVFSPSSSNGYGGIGRFAAPLMQLAWLALAGSDALRKMLHIHRPRETSSGAADKAHEEALGVFCGELEHCTFRQNAVPASLTGSMEAARDIFRAVPVDRDREMMLVGVVGEIFCRLNTFSNEDLIRKLEKFGATAWLSDITEWIWYTDEEQVKNLRIRGRGLTSSMAGVQIKKLVQRRLEHKLLGPLQGPLDAMKEPRRIREILDLAEPYLPWHGALGEMVLSAGKSIYMYQNGADGIIDISPFTCMNGIVSESIYPRLSRDHDNIPIRSFYFDGSRANLDNDLGIFMELVSNYNRRKKRKSRGINVA